MVVRVRAWTIPIAAVAVAMGLAACDANQAPEPGAGPSSARGKAEVFGDASLIPTRAGERARRELAISGELERALTRLGLAEVHVDVELHGDDQPPALVVIATVQAGEGPSEAEILALGRALIPTLTPAHLQLWLRPALADAPGQPPRPRERPWALLLTCLGLGLSLGVTGERIRARW
jgi:hypothetical protein